MLVEHSEIESVTSVLPVWRSPTKRNSDILEYLESFERYKDQSKQWKSDVKAGKKTESEYIEWLKAAKEKKVL